MAADVRQSADADCTEVESRPRTALVLYGSETGTAQELAEELGRLTERLHFTARVTDLNSINPADLLKYGAVLVVISTTGQGDLPANAQALWRKLRSVRLRPGCLANMIFTSFGLGDSSYPQFNWAHRKLHNRLKQLGGQVFCDRGESDEQHPEGVDGLFLPWTVGLRKRLLELFPLPAGLEPIPDDCFLLPKWKASIDGVDEADAKKLTPQAHSDNEEEETPSNDLIPIKDSFEAVLTSNTRLTPSDHWQDVRLFDFDCPDISPEAYSPGDVLTIYPKNFPADVSQLLSLMGWSHVAELPLHFVKTSTATDDTFYPPSLVSLAPTYHLTLRTLLTNHLDITAIPRRSFFATLAHFTTDETQHDRLVEFTSPDLVDELYDYTTRPRRSCLEVLQEFDTVRMPYEWVAALFPAMRGRQFSIASGGVLKQPLRSADDSVERGSGCRIQLLVAIVRYRTVIKRLRQGVCTRYMAALKPGAALSVSLTKSGMRVALDKPAIMIGPGTGVAPLRAMIWERAMLTAAITETAKADQILFFGARNAAADNFFAAEWPSLAPSLSVHAAFSRDQASKVYVQDLIRQHGQAVWNLVAHGGVIYICGSSGKMPAAVRESLVEAFVEHGTSEEQGGDGGTMTRAAAEKYLASMEKAGRYQQETW